MLLSHEVQKEGCEGGDSVEGSSTGLQESTATLELDVGGNTGQKVERVVTPQQRVVPGNSGA
jgi:hypothetical protein